mgnify:CR=1 FL=1
MAFCRRLAHTLSREVAVFYGMGLHGVESCRGATILRRSQRYQGRDLLFVQRVVAPYPGQQQGPPPRLEPLLTYVCNYSWQGRGLEGEGLQLGCRAQS